MNDQNSTDNSTLIGAIIVGVIILFAVIGVMKDKSDRQHTHDVYGPVIDSELRRRGVSEDAIRDQRQNYEQQYGLDPYDR